MNTKPNPLLGYWRLKAYFVADGEGRRSFPYGINPAGYLSYSAEGRMQVFATASNRPSLSSSSPSEDVRTALFDTMFAYGGTYSVEADTVTHHVDISWNQDWTGTEQVRCYRLAGDTLTLTMRVEDPTSHDEVHYTAEWEKIVTLSGAPES